MMTYDLIGHLVEQSSWSAATFGPGTRLDAITDHIERELVEVRESGALDEWIDLVTLALDGAWRTGATPDQVADALGAKLARNQRRTWPNWRTADPTKAIEHVHGSSPEDEPGVELEPFHQAHATKGWRGELLPATTISDHVPDPSGFEIGTSLYVRSLGKVFIRVALGWMDAAGEIEPPTTAEPLIDPDCRAGKHTSCVGGPCQCECHHPEEG
jgi:hypothetical protein